MSFEARQIADVFRVPYWLVTGESKPSVWRHPIVRLRAWWWSR